MLPSVTVGLGEFSLVPSPKDSSPDPLCVSAWRTSLTLAQSIDGDASSCLRFASVSISKLLPLRLASEWLANAATCQPTTSAMMTPSASTIARLFTTHSPTHYLLSLSLGSCLQKPMLVGPSNLPIGPVP